MTDAPEHVPAVDSEPHPVAHDDPPLKKAADAINWLQVIIMAAVGLVLGTVGVVAALSRIASKAELEAAITRGNPAIVRRLEVVEGRTERLEGARAEDRAAIERRFDKTDKQLDTLLDAVIHRRR